jgi:ketosteroid isomerase-like protein
MNYLLDGYLAFLTDASIVDGVFTDDVLLDMNVPAWRFQVQGVDALRATRQSAGGRWDVHAGPVTPTSAGFVVETSYDSVDDGVPHYTRSVDVVTVRDGRISKLVHYCTGPWDPETLARHASLEGRLLAARD